MTHHESKPRESATETADDLIASPHFRTYQEAVMEWRQELARRAARNQTDPSRIRLPYQPQIPDRKQSGEQETEAES